MSNLWEELYQTFTQALKKKNPPTVRIAYQRYMAARQQFDRLSEQNEKYEEYRDIFAKYADEYEDALIEFGKQNLSADMIYHMEQVMLKDDNPIIESLYEAFYRNNKTKVNASMLSQPFVGGAKTAPSWVRTARKVTINGKRGKPATKKTVYRNNNTGDVRVRKMVPRPDGTMRATYVKF